MHDKCNTCFIFKETVRRHVRCPPICTNIIFLTGESQNGRQLTGINALGQVDDTRIKILLLLL